MILAFPNFLLAFVTITNISPAELCLCAILILVCILFYNGLTAATIVVPAVVTALITAVITLVACLINTPPSISLVTLLVSAVLGSGDCLIYLQSIVAAADIIDRNGSPISVLECLANVLSLTKLGNLAVLAVG